MAIWNAIKEPERRGFRRISTVIDFERARKSMREITNLIDRGMVCEPAIEGLARENADYAHEMIDTGHVRGKLIQSRRRGFYPNLYLAHRMIVFILWKNAKG